MDNMCSMLAEIRKELRDFRAEHKDDLRLLKQEISEEVKGELKDFRQEIDQEIAKNVKITQEHETKLSAAEARIEELESSNMAMMEVLISTVKEHKAMRDNLTSLESHSRKNNLRIYNIPEGKERDSMLDFIEPWLKKELALPNAISLGIQRAHRAQAVKPDPSKPPRSVVINFLEYTTKEMVLAKAWEKSITIDGKRISFDNDYATETNQRRMAYKGVKKTLKEKNIRFKTPQGKMKIHWSAGVRTYDNAWDAADELRKKGYTVDNMPKHNPDDPSPEMERLLASRTWERVQRKRGEKAGGSGLEDSPPNC